MENPKVNKELSLELGLCLSGWSEGFANNEEINDAPDGLPMPLMACRCILASIRGTWQQ
jgi:hypothetical protein